MKNVDCAASCIAAYALFVLLPLCDLHGQGPCPEGSSYRHYHLAVASAIHRDSGTGCRRHGEAIPEDPVDTKSLEYAAREAGVAAALFSAEPDRLDIRFRSRMLFVSINIRLSQLYMNAHKYAESSLAAAKAYAELQAMMKSSTIIADSGHLVKIGIALIQVSHASDAISVFSMLSDNINGKYYYIAEAYFALNDRRSAAVMYEKWISAGCSKYGLLSLNLITVDEYGVYWGLAEIDKSGSIMPDCATLPEELWQRLLNLRLRYEHPNNMPSAHSPMRWIPRGDRNLDR